jgi:hypothetical protein
MERRG